MSLNLGVQSKRFSGKKLPTINPCDNKFVSQFNGNNNKPASNIWEIWK